ncbi:PREDICTED: CDGSH iron-sulfur domain-containing protein 2 [Merops nubicus]|uniref:CDGSH iron-sulfur domain-containing protein 2 n=1 Tax=Merops nubicus TaxID=57421 RepID=UPI0004F0C377|nr:PREDICTED: CDGSH iron-sulfur domain-containing protein 2 [Merops nubicus]
MTLGKLCQSLCVGVAAGAGVERLLQVVLAVPLAFVRPWCIPSPSDVRVADAARYRGGVGSQPEFPLSLVSEWLRLLPFLGVLALLGYLAVRPFLPKKKQQKDSLINLKIQKENPKVVNEINIEDLCLTKAYCRCWRSKTFPVCDGSHNKHNELTGDNVGPLILKKKEV